LLGNDQRIVTAHREAVKAAVRELETFAATRVRIAGANADRTTSNIVAVLFEHDTSRALDPHLHTHCILFNATHDATENRWKALQNHGMLAAQKYVQNVYYHELALALCANGYTVENCARGDFRIAEISPELCLRFSKRHQQIDEQTNRFLAKHPDKASGNIKAVREHLAHKQRSRKQHDIPQGQLRALWHSQLLADEKVNIPEPARAKNIRRLSAAEAVDWAEEHLFDRCSIVHEHELWYYALEFARGHRLTLAEIKQETASRPYIREKPDRITRRDVLVREWAMVQFARNGMRSRAPLAPDSNQMDKTLAEDQKIALQRILRSRGFVTLFRGGAGTGKSYVLRRVQEALLDSGRATHVLAPQRQQVFDLSKAGLSGSQTVAEFLARGSLADQAVVIVDEAGQIGAGQLLELLNLVQSRGGRDLLSGDTRQHGPVAASDALRAIERYSGLEPVELNEIRRRDPKRARDQAERTRIGEYRAAVKEASRGAVEASFDRLEQLGAITEAGSTQLRDELASAYVELARNRESVIVVSQTRAEIDEVNERIRRYLRENRLLAGVEEDVTSCARSISRPHRRVIGVIIPRITSSCSTKTSAAVSAGISGVSVELRSAEP
jgi:TrwC relaxase/AAA domain